MEILIAIPIVALAAGGLGLGLMLGRGAARSSCGASACLDRDRCAACPNRTSEEEAAP